MNQKKLKKYVHNKINLFNKDLSLNIDIHKVVFRPLLWEEYAEYWPRKKYVRPRIHINSYMLNMNIIDETIYHELGHAILDQYKIPGKLMSAFREKLKYSEKYVVHPCRDCKSLDCSGAEIVKPKAYVSMYASKSSIEDFCETLSAYYLNRNVSYGAITFSGIKSNLYRQEHIKKKFLAVEEILKYLSLNPPH